MLLPTPGATRTAVQLLREHGCTSVWFGAAAPLGLMAPGAPKAGAQRLVATTHGHEAGWAPAARRPATAAPDRGVHGHDHLPRLEYTRSRIAGALTPDAAARMVSCRPASTRRPSTPGSGGRGGAGPAGTDRAAGRGLRLAAGAAQGPGHPDPGDAPHPGRRARRRTADRRRRPLREGAAPPRPRHRRRRLRPLHRRRPLVRAARALRRRGRTSPCRAGPAGGGLDVEGLGIVYLEASATGLPVVAGDSGGAPDAVLDGETGWVVRG